MKFEVQPYYDWILLNLLDIPLSLKLKLLSIFKVPKNIFDADKDQFSECDGLTIDQFEKIKKATDRLQKQTEKECRDLEKLDIQLISLHDAIYPIQLLNIYDPPLLLYMKGSFLPDDNDSISIVGSRKASDYGLHTTETLCKDFSNYQITLVSGGARGIDACVHKTALNHHNRTIAVLGCGINIVYPPEHKNLFEKIATQGALLSEFPLHTKPMPFHFPKRNRIISGMTQGTIVIEAKEKSGSLITAHSALDQNKEVYAIPGPITSVNSQGTNALIQSGARLIINAKDIIHELFPFKLLKQPEPSSSLSGLCFDDPMMNILYSIIDNEPIFIEDIIKRSGLRSSEVSIALTKLEIKGVIKQLSGKSYCRG